jgi:hypothetical protein
MGATVNNVFGVAELLSSKSLVIRGAICIGAQNAKVG